MRRPWRGVAVVVCVAALGVAPAMMVAAPAGAGDDAQVEKPVVDGTTITAYYMYERMPFFEGGYKLSRKLQANIASIDCGPGGEQNPAGGPDGAFECGYHPAVTEATVTITGKKPWFDVSKKFVMTPYVSLNDKDYEIRPPVTVTADEKKVATTPKEKAGAAYLDAVKPVNDAITAYKAKMAAWTDKTKGTQAAKDGADLDKALDKVIDDLNALKDQYKPAGKAIKAQIKAVKALKGDITAAGALNEGLNKANFDKQFQGHIDDLSKASEKVRTKLGLPDPNAGNQQQPNGGSGAQQPQGE